MADDNPRGTYFQQVCTLHMGSFIVIDDRPCKVVKVDYTTDPIRRTTRYDFVAEDIFNGGVHGYSAAGNARCEVPFVHDMFYRIEDIYGDGRLVLRTSNGAKKVGPDLILAYDEQSLAQTRVDLYKGEKIMYVDVQSAMGEEHITCLKEMTEQPPKKRKVFRIR